MGSTYREDELAEDGQVRALFEIAAALRDIAKGLSYGGGEGMSIAETIEKLAERLPDAEEIVSSINDASANIAMAIDQAAEEK